MSVKKSYGIALIRYNKLKKNYEFLMIKKRNSYAFVDFVLGRYNINNKKYIISLFNNMTYEEKLIIISLNFEMIWDRFRLTHIYKEKYNKEIKYGNLFYDKKKIF